MYNLNSAAFFNLSISIYFINLNSFKFLFRKVIVISLVILQNKYISKYWSHSIL